MDNLEANWTADFLRDSVPPVETKDPVLQQLLESMSKVANVKPDIAYGLQAIAFDKTETAVNHLYHRHVVLSAALYYIWFIVEGKGIDGNIHDAENQCYRGGSAMVNARMKFNAKATTKKLSLGADLKFIAFSLAVAPGTARIYVHWAEIEETETESKEAKIVFHMNFLKDYSLIDRGCEGFTRLRHDINNILDWGTLERRQEIRDICKAIVGEMAKPKAKKA